MKTLSVVMLVVGILLLLAGIPGLLFVGPVPGVILNLVVGGAAVGYALRLRKRESRTRQRG